MECLLGSPVDVILFHSGTVARGLLDTPSLSKDPGPDLQVSKKRTATAFFILFLSKPSVKWFTIGYNGLYLYPCAPSDELD